MGKFGGEPGKALGSVSAAPFSSAAILPISQVYINMMGNNLVKSTEVAILNANYMAHRLKSHYKIAFTDKNGFVAHEFILDMSPFGEFVKVEDISKRLIDYGFHAPTVSWPVHDSLMIEPTESEPKSELDRLCDALISIRKEIQEVLDGKYPKENNVLSNAPHTAQVLLAEKWDRPYSREKAAYPVPSLKSSKYFPPVGRINSVYGDRNLICSCPSVDELAEHPEKH